MSLGTSLLTGTLLIAAGVAVAWFGEPAYARALAPLAEVLQDRVDPQAPAHIEARGIYLVAVGPASGDQVRSTTPIPVRAIGWTLPALLIGWGLLVRARWGTLVVVLLLFVAAHAVQAAYECGAAWSGENPLALRIWREGGQMLALVLALMAARVADRGTQAVPAVRS
ncbi:MAG: hypothetical protein AB7I45_01250 [Planctomycetota bacterium]